MNEGADEIDMVIAVATSTRATMPSSSTRSRRSEACGDARLKVMHSKRASSAPTTKCALASDIAIAAGADFIKTSTAEQIPAATMEVTLVMLHAIRDRYLKTGKMTP